jgi:ribonuclease D
LLTSAFPAVTGKSLAVNESNSHRWIVRPDELAELAAVMSGAEWCGLDSESNSGFAYHERLCLLQINVNEELWLVDLLVLPSGREALEPLREVLQDPERRIYLHGGEFDVGCFKRDYDIGLRGVWDTQQAASFLGWKRTGYGAVVESVCGVTLPKEFARHDWSLRPIQPEALQYALSDVAYLTHIGDSLRHEVRSADLEDEVEIANRVVEQATWNGGFQPDAVWRLKGARQLPEEGRAVLRALYHLRDEIARRLDRPPGRVLNNALLLALSRNCPASVAELRRLGVPAWIRSQFAAQLLAEIASARRKPSPLPELQPRRKSDPVAQRRSERLKEWRRQEAERRGVPLQVVLPVAAMRHLQEHGAGELGLVPQLGVKRRRLYGKQLAELCRE